MSNNEFRTSNTDIFTSSFIIQNSLFDIKSFKLAPLLTQQGHIQKGYFVIATEKKIFFKPVFQRFFVVFFEMFNILV